MSTVDARRRALRGTKRACQVCEVRFYDLGRDRIACPMCGADYALPAEPAVAPARAAPFANKTGWHRQPLKRPAPALPVAEPLPGDRFAAPADEENEPATVDSDDTDGVTEEQDETDAAGLFEHADSEEEETH